jgi:cell division protease FtsH
MSSKLGPLAFGKSHSNPFLGRDYNESRDYSEEVARMIDEEVRAIVEEGRLKAHEILSGHRKQLDDVANALLERETLNREEFLAIMEGRPLPELPQKDAPSADGPSGLMPSSSAPAPRLEPGPASG